MFPNPQDALPLPPRPSLDQYKKRAKVLLKASESSDPGAIREWVKRWIDDLMRLCEAASESSNSGLRSGDSVDALEKFARERLAEQGTLASAQFVVARAHGFESWTGLARHVADIGQSHSPIGRFEQAADAVIAGDAEMLRRLLREDAGLIHARSTRRHRATLLHYVAANGVENYRQGTPGNIVAIAEILLRAGADVNAVADIYGGSTTLGLVATSGYPERAGVQNALLQALLDHGTVVDSPAASALLVNICLANGRIKAAEFLANRGARLDMEGAAGLGRVDLVETLFDDADSAASGEQKERALLWACEYGRNEVVEFLVGRGVSVQSEGGSGQTALHWAVIGGQVETIRLLLGRGASLEAENSYGAGALGQAIWSALHGGAAVDYLAAMSVLLKAGAKIREGTLAWIGQQEVASPSARLRVEEILKEHGAES
jgi:ankyrin repeat protein